MYSENKGINCGWDSACFGFCSANAVCGYNALSAVECVCCDYVICFSRGESGGRRWGEDFRAECIQLSLLQANSLAKSLSTWELRHNGPRGESVQCARMYAAIPLLNLVQANIVLKILLSDKLIYYNIRRFCMPIRI